MALETGPAATPKVFRSFTDEPVDAVALTDERDVPPQPLRTTVAIAAMLKMPRGQRRAKDGVMASLLSLALDRRANGLARR
jgi:outer membrane lipopolysaccharide assembly protein LptE/RlpB